MGGPIDPLRALQQADQIARQQEARGLLWDRIASKASSDPEFKKQLANDPKAAIAREAETLRDLAGRPVTVADSVVHEVAEKAKALSTFLPDVGTDEVKKLIFDTIEDIRESFRTTLKLSSALFWTGLVMTAAAFVIAMFTNKEKASLVFGAGGVFSIVMSSAVMNPLDRVQRAARSLIQLQMAYLAYYKQVSMLGGQGPAQSREDSISYAQEIDRAAVSLITSIQLVGDAKPSGPSSDKKAPTKPAAPGKGARKKEQDRQTPSAAEDGPEARAATTGI